MTFQSPAWLWALLVLPILAAGLVYWARSRRGAAARYADPEVLPLNFSARSRALRTASAVALLLAVGAGILSLSRPSADATEDQEQSAIVLAIDVSNSMLKTDLEPSRLDAAVEAAQRFVDEAPEGTRVGVMTFSDRVDVLLAPESDKALVNQALDRIGETREGTVLGEAVVAGLGSLRSSGALDPPPSSPAESSGRILVLTDGANSILRAIPPADATARAAALNVPIYTIQLGDDQGSRSRATPAETLASMATQSGGIYAQSVSNEDLRAVFADIGGIVAPVEKLRELTVFAAAAALALLLLSALLAAFARPRPERTGRSAPA